MIEKRAYRNLLRHFDDAHPTVSVIAPLVCFSVAFTVVVLLRLVSSFGPMTARCVATDKFWYSSTGGNWPLAGSFILVLILLFAWNVCVGIDDWRRSKGTRLMVIVNAIGIASTLFFFSALHESANIDYNKRIGVYDDVKSSSGMIPPVFTESACETMRRFEGRWRIVERKVGYYGFDIPAERIELKPWGFVYAQDSNGSQPYADRWNPPAQYRFYDDDRWRDGYLFDAPWDFVLQGDTLILESSPEWFEQESERSRIVLEREPIPDKPVFPNPHSANK